MPSAMSFLRSLTPSFRLNRVNLKRPKSMPAYSTSDNIGVSVKSSDGPTGELKFVEEPLGMPASDGYGWPYLDFGEAVGPNERYIIRRKLGWGQSSSIWLARDQQDDRFVAIKVLNGASTPLDLAGYRFERQAYEQLNRHQDLASYCLISKSRFILPGRGSNVRHSCYVFDPCGESLQAVQDKHGEGRFSVAEAKHILLHLLRGIAHAHRCKAIHTDIKPDNILMALDGTSEDIESVLVSEPPRRHPPEDSADGKVEVAVSQPLILPSSEDILARRFVLADFGSAWPLQTHDPRELTAPLYRAPETILGQPWNEKIDIWSFGCLIFELLVGPPLFKRQRLDAYNLDPWENVLYQMMTYLQERFDPHHLMKTEEYYTYLDDDGVLLKNPPPTDYSIEACMSIFPFFPREHFDQTLKFMRRCLTLRPEARASADELLTDPWFDGVE